jgi:hypothetical protein
MTIETIYDSLLRGFLPQRYSAMATSIETLGVIVSLIISYFAYKGYKLTNEKKYKYFFYGFLFLAVNFLAHVVLNVLVNLDYVKYFVQKRYLPYIAPLFSVYYFFLIAALLAYVSFAIVYADVKHPKKIWLFYLWAFLLGAYTFRNQVQFNILSAIPLSFVALLAFEKYQEHKNKNQLFTSLSFFSLFLYHVLVIFQLQSRNIYIIRYFILLFGLVLLLVTLLRIFYGRKKK